MPGLFYPYRKLLCTSWRFCEWWICSKESGTWALESECIKWKVPETRELGGQHYFIYFVCVYFQKDNGWLVLKPNQLTRVFYWPKWVFPCWDGGWALVTPPIPLWCTLACNGLRKSRRQAQKSLPSHAMIPHPVLHLRRTVSPVLASPPVRATEVHNYSASSPRNLDQAAEILGPWDTTIYFLITWKWNHVRKSNHHKYMKAIYSW